MQVVLDVDHAVEARIRELAAKGDFNAAKRELDAPLDAALRKLASFNRLSPDEFEHLSNELARVFTENCARDADPLPVEALTREGIYGDHP